MRINMKKDGTTVIELRKDEQAALKYARSICRQLARQDILLGDAAAKALEPIVDTYAPLPEVEE